MSSLVSTAVKTFNVLTVYCSLFIIEKELNLFSGKFRRPLTDFKGRISRNKVLGRVYISTVLATFLTFENGGTATNVISDMPLKLISYKHHKATNVIM